MGRRSRYASRPCASATRPVGPPPAPAAHGPRTAAGGRDAYKPPAAGVRRPAHPPPAPSAHAPPVASAPRLGSGTGRWLPGWGESLLQYAGFCVLVGSAGGETARPTRVIAIRPPQSSSFSVHFFRSDETLQACSHEAPRVAGVLGVPTVLSERGWASAPAAPVRSATAPELVRTAGLGSGSVRAPDGCPFVLG